MESDVPESHQGHPQHRLDLEVWILRPKHQDHGSQESPVQEENIEYRRVEVFAVHAFQEVFKFLFLLWSLLEQMMVSVDSNVVVDSKKKEDEAE